jgi:La domain/Protein of unknown function (DUF3223)
MGEILSSDIHRHVETAWTQVEKNTDSTINRNTLTSLVEAVIQTSKISITKDQALCFCSPYLIGNKISKDQVLEFIKQQENQNISNLQLESIKRQVEYYFSDENLSHDKFFHELISSDENGYVKIEVILKCQRIKNLKATKEQVLESVSNSEFVEVSPSLDSLRRLKNKPLPALKSKKTKKNQLPEPVAVILSLTISEESKLNWKDIRDSFRAKYIDANIVYVRFHDNEGHIGVTSDTDIQNIIKNGLEINSHKATIKLLEGDELLEFWKANGNHYDVCSQTNKKRKFDNNSKKINMGGKMFSSLSQLKNFVNTLLNGVGEGNIDPHYHNLLLAIFRLHPEYETKSQGLKTFAIGKHPDFPESRCFFVVKEDGTKEDFSIAKCLQQL